MDISADHARMNAACEKLKQFTRKHTLGGVRDAVREYNAQVNAQERAPTGDDYNKLLDLIGGV